MNHNQWYEDNHREYPQRGLLAFADRYGVALASFALCAGIWVVTARATLEPRKDGAFFWLVGWFVVVIVLVFVRMSFLYLKDNDQEIARRYKTTPLKGLQGGIALLIACALIFIIEYFKLPESLAPYVWPIFIPGLIMGTQRFSERERPVHQSPFIPTRLSWLAIAYTCVAIYAMAFPVRHVGALALIKPLIASVRQPYFLGDGLFWREVATFIVPFVPAIWTGVVLLTVYYALRRSDVYRVQNDLLARLFEALVRMEDDPANAWNNIASLIQRRLGYHRAFILVPDAHYRDAVAARTVQERERLFEACRIQVLGSAGKGLAQMKISDFPVTSGLAHHCVETGESILVSNVKTLSPQQYVQGGFTDTVAELQVPIRDVDRNDIVLVGIIVVQHISQHRLTLRDEQTLRRVSRFLANYSRKFDSMWGYRHLEEELEAATSTSTSNATGVLQVLKRMCKSSSVAYVPLGFANRYPLVDRVTTLPDGFAQPEELADESLYTVDSPVFTTIKSWQPQFLNTREKATVDNPLPDAWKQWMQRERLNALALIPVGDARHPNGILLVGFSQLINGLWSDLERALATFGHASTPYLRNAGDRLTVYQQTFVTQSVNLHGYMNAEDLGRSAISRELSDMERMTRAKLKNLGERMLRVVNRLYEAEEMRPPDVANPSLEASIGRFRSALNQGREPAFDMEWRIDVRIERESLELKVILFRLITEAVFNALNHGHATKIFVRLARLFNCVWLVVSDDGQGFDVSQPESRMSKTHVSGIIHMGDCLEDLCGAAALDWTWTALGRGTCLKLVIPMLPDPSLSEKILVQDHLDSLEVWHDEKNNNALHDT